MPNITFKCDFCKNKERSEPFAWYKKRENHFCSRQCANKFNAEKKHSGLTRKEYEKQYWKKPENAERRKIMARNSLKERNKNLGISYIKTMLSRCRARALKKNLEFNLDVTDIEIPEFCPILNIKLETAEKKGGQYNSPSLDRINNNFGYIKGNVQVISKRANVIKSDASLEEIELVYKFLKKSLCQTLNLQ